MTDRVQDIYGVEADRQAFFATIFRPDISPTALVEYFIGYHGRLYNDQLDHFRRALAAAFARQGQPVDCVHAFDADTAINAAFLARHLPELQHRYLATGDIATFAATELLAPSVNQYRMADLPSPPSLTIGRAQRAALHAYRGMGGLLFVFPDGYQLMDADGSTRFREAASRNFSRDVLHYPRQVVTRPVVLIQDPADGNNFSHFLFDWVPRLVHFIRSGLEAPANCLFVLGGSIGAYQAMLLRAVAGRCGLSSANFLAPTGRMLLELRGPFYFFSDQVQAPLHPAHMAHPASIGIIREVLAQLPKDKGPHRRLFISRADARLRRLNNEAALLPILEPLGFHVLRLAEHDLPTQFALVRGAEIIVGPHGMGFTHIALHDGPLKVVELFHPGIGSDAYLYISRALGFEYSHMIGVDAADGHGGYTVPESDFAALVEGIVRPGSRATRPTGDARRDLVLGFCCNYDLAAVEPFLASLQHLGPVVEVVLFVANMQDDFHRAARHLGVRVEDATPYLSLGYHVINARHFMYRDFLARQGGDYRRVLLTDVRDVIFQSNPFEIHTTAPVSFAAEDARIHQDQAWNSRWLCELYGEAVLNEVADNWISCAGTTLGTVEGIVHYLDVMCHELVSREFDRSAIYDQGIHNYIVWKLRPAWGALDEDDRIVSTVIATARDRIDVRGDGIWIDQRRSPIIHQWDRQPAMVEYIQSSPLFKLDHALAMPAVTAEAGSADTATARSAKPSAAGVDAGPAAPTQPNAMVTAKPASKPVRSELAAFCPGLWRFLVHRYGVSSMLHVCCGDGRVVRFFHRLGVIANGIDGLKQNVDKAQHPIAWHDLQRGPYYLPVDLVLYSGSLAVAAAHQAALLDTLATARCIVLSPPALGAASPAAVAPPVPADWIDAILGRGYRLVEDNDALRDIARHEGHATDFAATGVVFIRA